MQKHDNKVGAQINLIKLPQNAIYEFDLDQSTDWVASLLAEMNENCTDNKLLAQTSLKISGEIEKKNKQEMSEILVVKGTIVAQYATECVRTLKPMSIHFELPFKVCFVDEGLATTEQFADIDETFVDNDVCELYFYSKRTVDFQEMLHEQIFLNYDQYPVLDADAKLLGQDWRSPTKA